MATAILPRLIISRLRELKYCTVPTESSQIFRHESPMEYLPFCRRVVDLDLRAIVFDACLLTEDNDWSSRVQARRQPARATGQPIWYCSRGLLARALGRTIMIERDSGASQRESTDRRATAIWSSGTLSLTGQPWESTGRAGCRLGSLQILAASCERQATSEAARRVDILSNVFWLRQYLR